jgi:hypothetical protein
MRYLSILLLLGFTLKVNSQQINPVPDYIFRNQMSVGRNAPTDTAAYLSVGPRYGANKGLMPPMVVDTNAVTGTKRNGLLIFSVQLNNFAYWDSTTSRFRQITAQAVVDSLVFSTRAWRKKGDDSLGAVIAVKTDTALLSTKAYRQKAVDSLVTLISTLGGGTVLSVGSGYGTNFSTITTSGNVVVDSLVITSRASRDKLKDSLNANIALKVNISDTSTMLSAYLRKADTTAMLTPYLRKGDTTAMLSPYVRTAGFGLTKGTQTLSVDSALMATRARVQKGIDSVASLVTTTDSVVFSTRAWRQKGVDSVAALANTKATATGTTNYLSKFTGTSSLGNSIVYATTSEVGISTPSPTHPLDVNGRVRVRTIDSTATGMNMLYADVDGVIKKAAIPAVASGTVTSVSAGTGMSFTTITSTGSVNADTVALSTRAWRQKGIDSVWALISAGVTGSGTTNRVAKFTASGAIGNGSISDSSTSQRMVINAVGNVHIGSGTTPAWGSGTTALSLSTGSALWNPGSGSNTFLMTNTFENGTNYIYRNTAGASMYRQVGAQHEWYSAGSGTAGNTISFSQPMTLTSSGRLLIGTTAEGTNTVDIAGTLRVAQQSYGLIRMERLNVDAGSGFIGASGNYSFIVSNGALSEIGQINISQAAPANSLFASSTGNIGLGTSSPATKLDVNGGALIQGALNISTSGQSRRIATNQPTGATGANFFIGGGGTTATYTSGNDASFNTSLGANAMDSLKRGFSNTAVGQNAMARITDGNANQAYGFHALGLMTTGISNNAFGHNSLQQLTSGTQNIAIGNESGRYVGDTGTTGNTTGNNNIFIGHQTRAKANPDTNEIVIGYQAVGNGSNTTTIGNAQTLTTFVRGRLDIGTIDSTASAINMLYADASGVIKKTAVPAGSVDSVKMRSNTITAASGWTIGEETDANTSINQVVRTEDLALNITVHVNTMLYKTTNTFSTGSWVTIGTVPVGYRPTNVVYFSLPNLVDGASFQATNNTDFTAVAQYSGGTSLRIKANGEIDVYVTTVDASADLSGANYVLMPVVVSYPLLPIIN